MEVKNMTTTPNTTEFYPTPARLAEKMLSGIDFSFCYSFLEPSAGKGDLAEQILRKHCAEVGASNENFTIDCVEVDEYLRQILKFQFSEEKEEPFLQELRKLNEKPYMEETEEDKRRQRFLESEIKIRKAGKYVHIVGDDFLKFHTYKHYDWIVMNPPFSEGDKHLLHAIQLQEPEGGGVVCLLNAETIRNPYTPTRKLLAQKLQQYQAEIEFLEDEFLDAERTTRVEIALIRLNIPAPERHSDIFEKLKREQAESQNQEEQFGEEPDAIASSDFIKAIVAQYNFEVTATVRLIHEYESFVPYMLNSLGDEKYKAPILRLSFSDSRDSGRVSINQYLKAVRKKYWEALFQNPQFVGLLTSNLRREYQNKVDALQDYDFSEFNIRTLYLEMMSGLCVGVEDTIMKLFDKLTAEHSWYPECQKNLHYFNGWKTNKAHKIGKKVILPVNGMFSDWKWPKDTFSVRNAYDVISDIQKSLDYLDDGTTSEVNLMSFLEAANRAGQTRNIRCKYFDIDLFKKGTMHIKFHPEVMKLIDRFNIFAAQKRGWLPPSYGKAAYSNMSAEEQAVIDSFQGEKAYQEVMANKQYYLAEAVPQMLLLPA